MRHEPIMKKRLHYPVIVSILALIFIVTPLSEAQTGPVVSIGSITTDPGSQVTLPLEILISNVPGVSAAVVKLSYDPRIVNVTNATMGDFTSSFTFDGSNSTKGWVIIKTFKTGTMLNGNVTMAEITLNAAGGSGESPLILSIISMNDHDGDNIPATTRNGTFRIIAPISTPDAALTSPGMEKNSPGLGVVLAVSALSVIYMLSRKKR